MQMKRKMKNSNRGIVFGIIAVITGLVLSMGVYAVLLANDRADENSIKILLILIVFVTSLIGTLVATGFSGAAKGAVNAAPALLFAFSVILGRIALPQGRWEGPYAGLLFSAAILPGLAVCFRNKGKPGKR